METNSVPTPAPSGAPTTTDTQISTMPSSAPWMTVQKTMDIVHGTTVIVNGSTGDVWSCTIPEATIFTLVSPTSPSTDTLVLTSVVVTGMAATGEMETGVPWSYTIPGATIVSSLFISIRPTSTSAPPSPYTHS